MSETIKKIFDAMVQKEGRFTFVEIPFSPRDIWGAKPRYPVTGTINGMSVRGTLGALGQDYFLRLGAKWMQDCGIVPGTKVTVQLSLEGPQEDSISSDISKALSDDEKAKAFFDGLPTFYRKNFIRWIESAKREQTRINRINEMIKRLSEGKREK